MTNKTIVALVIFLLVFSIASHAQSKSLTKLGEGVESSKKLRELREKLAVKNAEYQEALEAKDQKLKEFSYAIELLNKVLPSLEDKNQELKSELNRKEREFKKALAAKEAEWQEAIKTKSDELSEALAIKDRALSALEAKNQELKSELEKKEMKLKEVLATKNKKHRETLESKANELTEESKLLLALEPVFAYSLSISKEELSINIGVFDLQRVIDESQKGIEARRYLEGLISLRSEKELRMVEQQLISEIVKEIEIVIQEYAKKEGFTDIMEKLEGGVISNNKSFDITNVIIELYDRKLETLKAE